MTTSRLTAYALLLITAAIWGFAVPIIKVTLESFSPITFLTYRFFITTVILLPLLFIVEKPKLANYRKESALIILSGLLGSSVNLGILFWGLDNTTSLSASLLSSLTPLIAVVAAVVFLKEHVARQEKTGIVLAFFGTTLFILSSSLITPDTARTLFGDLLIIMANFALVAYLIITKKLLKIGYSAFFLTATMFAIGFFSMLPLAFLEHQSPLILIDSVFSQNLAAHAGVWYMAIFSGALAYFFYQEGQRRIEAGEAIVFNYLVPFFTAPLAFFWLKESISLPMIVSATVIALGVFIAEYRKSLHRKIAG